MEKRIGSIAVYSYNRSGCYICKKYIENDLFYMDHYLTSFEAYHFDFGNNRSLYFDQCLDPISALNKIFALISNVFCIVEDTFHQAFFQFCIHLIFKKYI